ncbi:MAG: isoprenyl transferase [Bacillota bacterium]|jgi:undecaprenyl diphosphate synthase|nr:isoprenyl transferase [Bacillota bacterium]
MKTNKPAHIAIIMDGNGRWAKKRGLPRVLGHREGMKRVIDIVRHASHADIQVLTLYAFSTENWKRPTDEVEGLMRLLLYYVETQLTELIKENVRVRIIGEQSAFSPEVKEALERSVNKTKHLNGMILQLALNYGGRDELVRAFRRLQANGSEINESAISSALDTGEVPDPDLLIRTGGEMRLSNFLLYQAAYAELHFTETYWPDFHASSLDAAIEEFSRRHRRFGDVK